MQEIGEYPKTLFSESLYNIGICKYYNEKDFCFIKLEINENKNYKSISLYKFPNSKNLKIFYKVVDDNYFVFTCENNKTDTIVYNKKSKSFETYNLFCQNVFIAGRYKIFYCNGYIRIFQDFTYGEITYFEFKKITSIIVRNDTLNLFYYDDKEIMCIKKIKLENINEKKNFKVCKGQLLEKVGKDVLGEVEKYLI